MEENLLPEERLLAQVEGLAPLEEMAEPEGLKGKCSGIAFELLGLDNALARAVSELEHRDYGGVKYATLSASEIAFHAMVQKFLSADEAALFLAPELTDKVLGLLSRDEGEKARDLVRSLHEQAEKLLLEKVIACECGQEK